MKKLIDYIKENRIISIVLGVCLLILILLAFITIQAIVETENWKLFDIDYTNKEKVISGYGALLGALISSLSVILLVYTIYLQVKESNEQKERFKKEHALQKEHFRFEERKEQNAKREDKFLLIKLISVFLDSIIKHIEETGVELLKFIDAERNNPLKTNMLFFLVNKSISKLIEMDHLSIFKGFKEFFSDEKEWIIKYQLLFNSVGFYNDALLELRANYDYHKTDKYSRMKKIGEDLKNIMDESSRLLNRYKHQQPDRYLKYPYAKIINEFVPKYYEYLEGYQSTEEETDFDDLSQNLLKDFITECMEIRKNIGFDNFGIEELVIQVSSIRKKIWGLKNDCIYFAENNQERYNDFYALESKNLVELKELKTYLDQKIKFLEN